MYRLLRVLHQYATMVHDASPIWHHGSGCSTNMVLWPSVFHQYAKMALGAPPIRHSGPGCSSNMALSSMVLHQYATMAHGAPPIWHYGPWCSTSMPLWTMVLHQYATMALGVPPIWHYGPWCSTNVAPGPSVFSTIMALWCGTMTHRFSRVPPVCHYGFWNFLDTKQVRIFCSDATAILVCLLSPRGLLPCDNVAIWI
jgi:hypothetical protein